MGRKKNILVVDDSALMRRLISDIINSDERFQVSDLAMNGLEAFDLVTRERGGMMQFFSTSICRE